MVAITWNALYPGILIDDRQVVDDGIRLQGFGEFQGRRFIAATSQCLDRLASQPIGHDLLSLISKRCRGVGVQQAGLTCRILFGPGTLTGLPGQGPIDHRADVRTAIANTDAMPDIWTGDLYTQIGLIPQGFRSGRYVGGRYLQKAGRGVSAAAVFNPFVNYDTVMVARLGVRMPPFIALGHELVHALHMLSGDQINRGSRTTMIEEARTIGAGKYADTRISENALRAEHGLAPRRYYTTAGDCDNP